MAKDIFHDTVKLALQKDGWRITHDPYRLRYGIADIYIDLAAEEAIAAEKAGRKIAVEVKSFVSGSTIWRVSYCTRSILELSHCLRNLRRARPYSLSGGS